MEENKIIEGINNEMVEQVYEGVTDSNGNVVVKLVIGAVGVAIGVGAALIYKKRKNRKQAAECVEYDSNENSNQSDEE